MTTQSKYDVAIVGASIAGCTAAVLFARRGLSVALIERHADPNAYKRICTHFIQPSATPTIKRLGLAQLIEEAGGIRNGFELWSRWGWIRPSLNQVDGHPTYGYNIRRQTLDPMLRRLATSTPGVTLMPGQNAHRLLMHGQRIAGVGVRDRNGGTTEVTARLVVAADGRNSHIAKLAQVPVQIKPHNRFLYFAYYRNLPLTSGTNSQMWMLDPDIGYAFPNDDGLTLLGCCVTKDKLAAFRSDLQGQFRRFFADLPLGPKLTEGEQVSNILGMIELPNQFRSAACPGLALIGDAALASDPLWGVGCGWAFQSGEWLVDCTADALISDGDLDRALKRYHKKHRSALGGHHFLIADYSTGRGFNLIEKLYLSASVKDPVTANHFGALGARSIGAWQFLRPSAIARAIWVNLAHRQQKHTTNLQVAP